MVGEQVVRAGAQNRINVACHRDGDGLGAYTLVAVVVHHDRVNLVDTSRAGGKAAFIRGGVGERNQIGVRVETDLGNRAADIGRRGDQTQGRTEFQGHVGRCRSGDDNRRDARFYIGINLDRGGLRQHLVAGRVACLGQNGVVARASVGPRGRINAAGLIGREHAGDVTYGDAVHEEFDARQVAICVGGGGGDPHRGPGPDDLKGRRSGQIDGRDGGGVLGQHRHAGAVGNEGSATAGVHRDGHDLVDAIEGAAVAGGRDGPVEGVETRTVDARERGRADEKVVGVELDRGDAAGGAGGLHGQRHGRSGRHREGGRDQQGNGGQVGGHAQAGLAIEDKDIAGGVGVGILIHLVDVGVVKDQPVVAVAIVREDDIATIGGNGRGAAGGHANGVGGPGGADGGLVAEAADGGALDQGIAGRGEVGEINVRHGIAVRVVLDARAQVGGAVDVADRDGRQEIGRFGGEDDDLAVFGDRGLEAAEVRRGDSLVEVVGLDVAGPVNAGQRREHGAAGNGGAVDVRHAAGIGVGRPRG